MTPANFSPVPLDKSYRLLNHGPTVLVSARHGGVTDVMAAAWACVLDYGQTPRVTVVLDKATHTRELIEASGAFALQLPTRAQLALTVGVGTDSLRTMPDKLVRHGVQLFEAHQWATCRWWPVAWAGWPAGCGRSRTTSRPTTCSSATWLGPGRTSGCSAPGAGSSTPRRMSCAPSTMWPAGSFL
jgi:hypothetical protein